MSTQNKNIYNRLPKKKLLYKSPLFLVAIALCVLVGGVVLLELSNTTHFFHSKKTPTTSPTASQNTKGEPSPSQQAPSDPEQTSPGTSQSSGSQPGDSKSDTGGTPTTTLLTPSGTFVSAHKVPSNAALSSVCNTTPGVNCQIIFSASDGRTKSLPIQITDRGGSTYWNSWSPKGIGLTAGTWQIKAVASLNGKTVEAVDALSLEVSP